MDYRAPYGSADPDASYVDKDVPGAVAGSKVPAPAIEFPMREIGWAIDILLGDGAWRDAQDGADLKQLARAIRSGALGTFVIIGAPHSANWTVPANVHLIAAALWGSGGGGGYGTGTYGGAGGGAGGFSFGLFDVTPGDNHLATVPVGGAGGTSGVNAVNGAIASLGSFLSASGGVAGHFSGSPPGAGGIGTGGLINLAGGDGLTTTNRGAQYDGGKGGVPAFGSGYSISGYAGLIGNGGTGGGPSGNGTAGGAGRIIIRY